MQRLLEYHSSDCLVTSAYFNLDRSKFLPQLLRIRIKDLLQAAHRELAQKTATHAQRESLREDFRLIEEEVGRVLQLMQHRGLAIFSCAAQKFWQTYPLPRMFRNLLVADRQPYVRPLLAILEQYRRFGVLLLDRTHGRLFEMYMGELVERSEILSPMPRHSVAAGFGGREERSRERHYVAAAHQHYARLAAAALDLQKATHFDALILGGPTDVLREFKQQK
ncbi:MAG: hypothetical protein N3B01_12175 [Verrucomicrobiae bacterium]|nr:hypothetical protein [Verrucomicrobiae bacterium]